MSSPAVVVTPNTPLKDAAALLARFRYTALPVVNTRQQLVGMVDETDLGSGAGTTRKTVTAVMVREVDVAAPDTDVRELAQRMRAADLRALPVVADHRVLGVVTLRDLTDALTRADEQVAAEIRRKLNLYGGGYEVEVLNGAAVITDKDQRYEQWPIVRQLAEQTSGIEQAQVKPQVLIAHQPERAAAQCASEDG